MSTSNEFQAYMVQHSGNTAPAKAIKGDIIVENGKLTARNHKISLSDEQINGLATVAAYYLFRNRDFNKTLNYIEQGFVDKPLKDLTEVSVKSTIPESISDLTDDEIVSAVSESEYSLKLSVDEILRLGYVDKLPSKEIKKLQAIVDNRKADQKYFDLIDTYFGVSDVIITSKSDEQVTFQAKLSLSQADAFIRKLNASAEAGWTRSEPSIDAETMRVVVDFAFDLGRWSDQSPAENEPENVAE